jgi:hypothetical protein
MAMNRVAVFGDKHMHDFHFTAITGTGMFSVERR